MQFMSQTIHRANIQLLTGTDERPYTRHITANQFKPVSQHFTSLNHTINNVTITGLLLTNSNANIRLRTEEALITLFGSLEPAGLNRRYG